MPSVKDVAVVGNSKKAICVMAAATGNVAAPSAATDGVAVYPGLAPNSENALSFGGRPPTECTLAIKGTVNAGQTLVGTFTLWGYLAAAAKWFEIPLAGGNEVTATALAETDTDVINHQERVLNLGHWDRVALQLANIGGTGASFEAWLINDNRRA